MIEFPKHVTGENNKANARREREVPQMEGGQRTRHAASAQRGPQARHRHGQDGVPPRQAAERAQAQDGGGRGCQQEAQGI